MKLMACVVLALSCMVGFAGDGESHSMEYPWDGQYKTVTLTSMNVSSPTQEREKVLCKWVYLDKSAKTYYYQSASGPVISIAQDSVKSVDGKVEGSMPILQVEKMTLNCKNGRCVFGREDRTASTSK